MRRDKDPEEVTTAVSPRSSSVAGLPVPIPAYLYGTYAEVSRAAMRRARRFADGGSLVDDGEHLLDAGTSLGLIVLSGPIASLARSAHFQMFALPYALSRIGEGSSSIDVSSRFFDEAVSSPSGVLMLMGQFSYGYLRTRERVDAYLLACARFWPALYGLGSRFTAGPGRGRRLWPEAFTLGYALVQAGASREELMSCRPDAALDLITRWAPEKRRKPR